MRFRLFPGTLFSRNLWLIVALIVGGQIVNALAYGQFIAKPRLRQSAEATARSLQAVAEGLSLLPEDQRAGFVARFNARAGSGQDDKRRERATLLERGFLAELAAQLGLPAEQLAWRREANGLIAVRLPEVPFWLVVPSVQPAHRFARTWIIASAVSGALALLGAWLIQRRINRPLARLVDATKALGEGRRRVVLPTDGPAETAALARGFNDMAQALARDEEERLLMLAGLSHDLRTPLAKIRLASELLRDAGQGDPDLLDTLDRSLHGLDGLLTQFLDYARASHPAEQDLPTVDVELREFLADTIALAPGLPQPTLAHGAQVWLPVRPQALRRLVLNLVVNAQTHGAPPIELTCGESDAGERWIEVRDRGPGIAPARVDELKRPFQRGDVARGGKPGSGLGLAIVERIARSEGATLQLLPRDGGGLVARVSWVRLTAP